MHGLTWVRNKTSKSVATAFDRILARCKEQHPVLFQTDIGKEFLGKEMQQVLKNNSINYRVVRNPDIKAVVVERFNRTLRDRLWRYFTHTNTYRYIDILQKIVDAYNNSWHSGTKMVPAKVNLHNAAKHTKSNDTTRPVFDTINTRWVTWRVSVAPN